MSEHYDIPTGRIDICEHCKQPIAEVRDPISGTLDWYSNGGDFGCGESPKSTDEGVGSHKPRNS